MKFFQLTPNQVAEQLSTDLSNGLSLDQVELKQRVCGKNELVKSKNNSFFSRFMAQFKDYTIVAMLTVAVISAVFAFLQKNHAQLVNALAIIIVIILNGVIGLLQSYKVERTLTLFPKYNAHKAIVIRQSEVREVFSEELVPGDIVLLKTGDLVPADGRIFECSSLKINESILSDVSLPAEKQTEIIEGDNHPVSKLNNMVFSGTIVLRGTAKIIVTAIGMETQISKKACLMHENSTKTPLLTQLAQMGRVLSLGALAICLVLFVAGIIEGKAVFDILLTVIALAVAFVPEGLTGTVAVVLALGMRRLFQVGMTTKNMEIVKSLGNVDVICVDKTGVLTEDKMRVTDCFVKDMRLDFTPGNYKMLAEIILYGSMCNDAMLNNDDGQVISVGDSTEGAILSALCEYGIDKNYLDKQYPRMGVVPFNVDRKRKSTIHIVNGRNLVVVKGSPEVIYNKCNNQSFVENAIKVESEMAGDGQRVLAIAVKEVDVIPSELFADEIESNLTLIGLIGLSDVVYSETDRAIEECRNAGIRAIMFSGDHIVTAKAVAEKLGIFSQGDIALSGQEISAMSKQELENVIENCNVYSRLSAEQKVCVVESLQGRGNNVLITGNRASDTVALEKADVGLAMADFAVDAAKESADIVTNDDSFTAIIAAIRRSRGIFNNIQKTVIFLLSSGFSGIMLIFFSVLFMFQLPVRALHLLCIDFFIVSLLALAIGMECARDGLMQHPPRSPKQSLITKSVSVEILWQGVLIAVVSFLAFLIGTNFKPQSPDVQLLSIGQTMSFATLAFSQILHSYDKRSKHSLFKIGFFGNRYINLAAFASAALVVLIIIIPGISAVFGVAKLKFIHWLTIVVLSIVPLGVCETVKILKNHKTR